MKTIRDVADELFTHIQSRNYSPRTVRGLRSGLRQFIAYVGPHFGVDTADRLRAEHLHAYQQHLAEATGRRGLPLKPSTVNSRIYAVHALLRFMRQRGYIITDMTEHLVPVKIPKFLPKATPAHRDVRKIMRMVDTGTEEGIMHRAVLELLYTTGLRSGEIVSLTLDNIDFEHGCAKVCGKGSKERVVPIGRTALRWLISYVKAVRPFNPGRKRYRAVFLNRRGRPLGQKSVQAFVPAYAEKAGMEERITPHAFRRSCTTELIREGANVYHVKDLLGHESIETLRPYINLTIVDLKKTHAKCHPRERDEKRERG